MNRRETEMGGPARSFPATSWTLLEEAKADKAGAEGEGFRRLAELYWKPVYSFIRQSGPLSNEDAKDLTQEFFTRIVLGGSLVDRFQPEQGSFRPYLKTAIRNFLHQMRRDGATQKRGGEVSTLSTSGLERELSNALPDANAATPEEAFDQAWERIVLAQSLKQLELNLRAEGKAAYWEVFQSCELNCGNEAPSYQEVAERLGLTRDTVKNYLTSARKSFLEAARHVLVQHVDSPEDLSNELSRLFRKP